MTMSLTLRATAGDLEANSAGRALGPPPTFVAIRTVDPSFTRDSRAGGNPRRRHWTPASAGLAGLESTHVRAAHKWAKRANLRGARVLGNEHPSEASPTSAPP